MVKWKKVSVGRKLSHEIISTGVSLLAKAIRAPRPGLKELDDYCIRTIFRYLDYRSFYNLQLACKSFHDIGSRVQNENESVLKRKATDFLIKHSFMEHQSDEDEQKLESLHPNVLRPRRPTNLQVEHLLEVTRRLSLRIQILSPRCVRKFWLGSCPVAGKLYLMLRDFDLTIYPYTSRDPRPSCFIEEKFFKFQLSGNQSLVLSYWKSYDINDTYWSSDFSLKASIRPEETYNAKAVETEDEVKMRVQRWQYLNDLNTNEVLIQVVQILQRELGVTSTPITTEFLLEFLNSIPHHRSENKSIHRIYFTDAERNRVPELNYLQMLTTESRQRFVNEYWKLCSETGIEARLGREFAEFVEHVFLIALRLGVKAVDMLTVAHKFSAFLVKNNIGSSHPFRKILPDIDLLDTLGEWGMKNEVSKHVWCELQLRLRCGKSITVLGKSDSNGKGLPYYMTPKMYFRLPNGRYVKLQVMPCLFGGFQIEGRTDSITELIRRSIGHSSIQGCADRAEGREIATFFYVLLDFISWNLYWVYGCQPDEQDSQ